MSTLRIARASAGVVMLVGLALPLIATAETVYTQPSLWSGAGADVGSAWSSQTDASLTGYRTLDNFTLASDALINQVSWLGFYFDLDNDTGGSPNTSDWIIRFQADNGGIPGSVLSSATIPAADVTVQALGAGVFNVDSAVTVYQFTANFPAFGAAAWTTYWFSPLSRAASFSPVFGWIQGGGGDSSSFQTAFANGSVTDAAARDGDRAFTLSTAVPLPSTLPLLLTGVLAPVWRARRR